MIELNLMGRNDDEETLILSKTEEKVMQYRETD